MTGEESVRRRGPPSKWREPHDVAAVSSIRQPQSIENGTDPTSSASSSQATICRQRPLFRVNFTACSQADPVSGYYANRTERPGSPRGTSITRNLLERSASLSEALAPATAALQHVPSSFSCFRGVHSCGMCRMQRIVSRAIRSSSSVGTTHTGMGELPIWRGSRLSRSFASLSTAIPR